MKIYRVSCSTRPSFYCGSQAEAGKRRKQLNTEYKVPRGEIATDEIEFDPTKTGILDLLNGLEVQKG